MSLSGVISVSSSEGGVASLSPSESVASLLD